jgi:hypothetical protein
MAYSINLIGISASAACLFASSTSSSKLLRLTREVEVGTCYA